VFVSLLDLSKAFDCVNHSLLFPKLIDLELPCNLVKFLAYWYLHQLMNVRWNNTFSASFYMHNGTRQGSILSPYLFSVYIRNVSKTVVNSGIGCHIGNMPCNILLYADDIVIMAPSWDAQQKLLNLCYNEICSISMCLNVAKSITLIFSPYKSTRRVLLSFPEFNLCGHRIVNVNRCKYLGHWLSTVDDDNTDIENHIRLLYARTNFLIRRFSKCSTAVKICLFKAYCINFYGIALWKRHDVTVMRKFQAAYNKYVKLFFGYERRYSLTAVFMELKLSTVATVLYNAQHKFVRSITGHDNALVNYVQRVCNSDLVR
jgi:hypothetical protein